MRWLIASAVFGVASPAPAQLAEAAPPPAQPAPADASFSLAGEVRERVTWQSAIAFDSSAPAAGLFWTQRVRIAAEVELAPMARARVSIGSAINQGGGATSPVERNDLDLQEAFVDLGSRETYLRLGRQELGLGSQRLVAVRDGTTVRRNWDGARGHVSMGAFEIDGFALRLVQVRPEGAFNDGRNEGRDLLGVRADFPALSGRLETYWLYAKADQRSDLASTTDEHRHSFGTRAAGSRAGWFWDLEAVYQTGRFGSGSISAWTLATNTGHRWRHVPWQPELMVSLNIASGDNNPEDGQWGTFNALYPNASYFSQNAVLGPSNFFNLHPHVTIQPRADLKVGLDLNLFWRLERADGVYNPQGALIRAASGSRRRFVDVTLSSVFEWAPRRGLLFSLVAARSQPQGFIRATGPADPSDFLEATLRFTF